MNEEMIDIEKKDGYAELDKRIQGQVYGQDQAVDAIVEN